MPSIDNTPFAATPAGKATLVGYPTAASGWFATAILCFLYTLSFVDRNIMVLLAEPVSRAMGLNDFQMSLLYGPAFAVIFALAGLPLGWAIDRFSRRSVIWLGVFVWSVTTTACGFAANFPQMFAARAGVGAGEAVLVPGSQSILADMFPPDRLALPLSIYGLGGKLGGGFSFVLGGLLILLFIPDDLYDLGMLGTFQGWQLIFITAGLPGVILAFAIFLIPEPARNRIDATSKRGGVSYLDYGWFVQRNFRFIGFQHCATVVLMVVMTGITTWSPAFFMRVHGWTSSDAGFWLGLVMMIGPVIGIPIHGVIADRLFRKGMHDAHLFYLTIMLLLGLPPAVAAYFVPDAWLSLCLLGLAMALIVAYLGLLPATLQLMVPGNMRGKAASVGMLVGALGGMTLGPVVVAVLTESVFQQPGAVGKSIATCVGFGIPVVAIMLTYARKPMRDAGHSKRVVSG